MSSAAAARPVRLPYHFDGFALTFVAALAGLLVVSAMKAAPPGPFSPKRG